MKANSHQSAVPEAQSQPLRTARGAAVRLWLAAGTAAVTVLVSTAPLNLAGSRWLALAFSSVLALWCAFGLHRSALLHLLRGALHADILASIAVLATYLWAAAAISSDQAKDRFAVAAVVAILALAVRYVREKDHCAVDDVLSRWLIFGVPALAMATLAVWWVIEGSAAAFSAAIAVLVVGSSAALALAGPAAILIGTKRGAQFGLRFGGMSALDAARCIDTIVLDKHKTVTTGDLTVVSVNAIDPDHDRNMRWFAGALEHTSDHPVGLAIAKLAGHGRVTDVEQLPGLGVSGAVDRHPVRVGSPDWIGLEATEDFGTTVAVEVDGRPLGRITVADAVRPHAHEAVEHLRRLGLNPVLVSDGTAADTEHLATQVGIDTRFPDLAADKRSGLVVELQLAGHTVAMAGDRDLNASALDAANLAITRLAAPDGAVTGLTVTDIDVSIVAVAIRLSRATLARAETNRRLALAAICVAAPLAALGLINPAFAALVAVVSTAVVGGNTVRLQAPSLHPPVPVDD